MRHPTSSTENQLGRSGANTRNELQRWAKMLPLIERELKPLLTEIICNLNKVLPRVIPESTIIVRRTLERTLRNKFEESAQHLLSTGNLWTPEQYALFEQYEYSLQRLITGSWDSQLKRWAIAEKFFIVAIRDDVNAFARDIVGDVGSAIQPENPMPLTTTLCARVFTTSKVVIAPLSASWKRIGDVDLWAASRSESLIEDPIMKEVAA